MMKKGFSSTALSVFAALCMVVDHFAAAFISESRLYFSMRSVGRMAFPIFLFLLTEGVKHTSSKPRYLARLAVFAIISEPFFDLLFYRKIFYPAHQNTIFTLFICALSLMLLEKYHFHPNKAMLCLIFCTVAADIFGVDGSSPAILLAAFWGGSMISKAAALAVFSVINNFFAGYNLFTGSYIWNLAALIPISLYNGKRGGENCPLLLRKWGFYIFYPLHLAVLMIIYLCVLP